MLQTLVANEFLKLQLIRKSHFSPPVFIDQGMKHVSFHYYCFVTINIIFIFIIIIIHESIIYIFVFAVLQLILTYFVVTIIQYYIKLSYKSSYLLQLHNYYQFHTTRIFTIRFIFIFFLFYHNFSLQFT